MTVGEIVEDITRLEEISQAFLDYEMDRTSPDNVLSWIHTGFPRVYLDRYICTLKNQEVKEKK